ncbi:hypothetical protein ACQKNN_18255 [Bacillus paramycoides]|uniref:hypothetical protein n=1 Tax=Bacillus paramycoides TaxID=2026194 RepID=UPI0038254626
MKVNTNWSELFSEKEQQRVYSFQEMDRQHPLRRVLFPPDNNNGKSKQVAYNTLRAFNFVKQYNNQWLVSLKKRLLEEKDFSTSSAALGELRAYGYLLEAGIKVEPVPCQKGVGTPEFKCSFQGKTFIVEVHSKQMDNEEAKSYYEFKKNGLSNEASFYNAHTVTPFGKPKKPEDTVGLNAISKICSIKQRGHQLSKEIPSIIWMDFQDQTWSVVFDKDNVHPFRTFRGRFTSGEIWYAFYGWKEAPVFDSHSISDGIGRNVKRMGHNGRFRLSSDLSAVIISFPGTTCILENPFADNLLPKLLWEPLSKLNRFSVEDSYTHMFTSNLIQKIELERTSIVELENNLKYLW